MYATANPYGAHICQNTFYDLETTFRGEIKHHSQKSRVDEVVVESGETFSNSHVKFVEPSSVTRLSSELHERYPEKRLITHYMQPHKPYLGSTAKTLREDLRKSGVFFARFHKKEEVEEAKSDGMTVVGSLMEAAKKEIISNELLKEIYIENLHLVLEEVEALIENLNGKTIITADHGELLGESGRYNHPQGRYDFELRKVPWLIIDNENRRSITKESQAKQKNVTEKEIEGQLRALGYK